MKITVSTYRVMCHECGRHFTLRSAHNLGFLCPSCAAWRAAELRVGHPLPAPYLARPAPAVRRHPR